MFFDSAEETLTLTMGDLQLQSSRMSIQPNLSPPPPPQPLYSLKYSSTSEQVDVPDHGFDFYSSPFDNSFPYRGFLSNERSFSCSSPTNNTNTSFLSETSFSTQSNLRNSNDSGITSDCFGLLTTTSTPYRGNDANNVSSDFQRLNRGGGATFNNGEVGGSFLPSSHTNQLFNDSGLSSSSHGSNNGFGCFSNKWDSPTKPLTSTPNHSQFDFTFPEPPNTGFVSGNSSACSSNGSSNASADSPSRLLAAATAAGTNPCSFTNQWNSSDVSSLLDNQSSESLSSNSVITTPALGNSIWSPSSQVSAVPNNTTNGNGYNGNPAGKSRSNSLKGDESLVGWNKDQLLHLVELLKDELDESMRAGDESRSNQLQGAIVRVQNHIITMFVSDSSDTVSTPSTTIPSPILPSPTESSMGRSSRFGRDFGENLPEGHTHTWSGHLPPRNHRNPTYSSKVFLGGLPWDITESTLMQTFKPFGIMKIEWPGKEGIVVPNKPKGYAYAIFESEKMVKQLLDRCTHDYSHSRSGNFYYKISSKKYRGKDVQIIPWALSDSIYNRGGQQVKIDPEKTIFVGALHGMVNAEGLATIMDNLFGPVIYAGIDTDRTKYPIGSARVTFSKTSSYFKAIKAAYVFIKTPRFEKRLQVDPYLDDAVCSVCGLQQGPYFCRDKACFSYFCRTCFQTKHSEGPHINHKPMMRTAHNKPQQQQLMNGPYNNYNGHYNNNNNNNNHLNGGPMFSHGHHHPPSYSYGTANNHHLNQPPYPYGNGGPNYQPYNNHVNGNAHHGFSNGGNGNNGNNYRQWSNANNERNSPQVNGPTGGGGFGVLKRSRCF